MLANGKRLMASLPKDFQAELVSAEFRYLKPRDGSEAKAADAAAPLVIRIRFTNGDDTLDSSGWSVVATAKDEFGNTITGVDDAAFMSQRTAELNETHDIPPGKAAVRTFVFSKPIPKATAVTLSFGVSFPRRPSSIPFGPTLKVPLPAAK